MAKKRITVKNGNRPAEILFLPGLGADRDMYLAVISELMALHFPFTPYSTENLPMQSEDESLESYTKRIIEAALPEGHNGRFDAVVGCSMGGMIAAKALEEGLIQTDSLFLISSALNGRGLTWFSGLSLSVFPWIPGSLRGILRDCVAWLYPVFRFWVPWSVVIATMIRRADKDLLFQASRMIHRWKGCRPENLPVRNFWQIHGTMDPILSYRRLREVRPPDVTVPLGGHILFLTHAPFIAREIIRILKK